MESTSIPFRSAADFRYHVHRSICGRAHGQLPTDRLAGIFRCYTGVDRRYLRRTLKRHLRYSADYAERRIRTHGLVITGTLQHTAHDDRR